MPTPPTPSNEHQRVHAIRAYSELDRKRAPWADALAQTAARIAGVPIALVSILDEHDQWFKGAVGFDLQTSPRDHAFCAFTILRDTPLVVEDATQDPRFADNPFVTSDDGIRFYTGFPIIDPDGICLGTLGVLDTKPNSLSDHQMQTLRGLADVATQTICASKVTAAARSDAQQLADENSRLLSQLDRTRLLSASVEHAKDSIYWVTTDGRIRYANQTACEKLQYTFEELTKLHVYDLHEPDWKIDVWEKHRERLFDSGSDSIESIHVRKDGSRFPVEITCRRIILDGETYFFGFIQDISERVEAHNRRDFAERHLKLFVEHSPAAVAMLDTDMRYLVASKGWYHQYQLQGEDIIGKPHYDVFPNVPERWKRIHRRALAGETLSNDRDAFEREDGATTWLSWRIEPWRDASGDIGGIMMFTEVITDRVAREEQLRVTRERLDLAMQAAGTGLWDWNLQTNTAYFCDTFQAMLGYNPGDFPLNARDWNNLFHPDDLPRVIATLQDHLKGNTTDYRAEYRLRCRDDSWKWVLSVGRVVERDKRGKPVRMAGVHVDISEQKATSTRLELAVDSANAGLWDWAVRDGIFVTNDEYHRMIGEQPANRPLPAVSFFARVHPDDAEAVSNAVHAAHKHDARYFVEFRFLCEDGSYKWIRSTGAVVEREHDGSATRMIGQHVDIDASKRLEVALSNAVTLKPHGSEQDFMTAISCAVNQALGTDYAAVIRLDPATDHTPPTEGTVVGACHYGAPSPMLRYTLTDTPCEVTLEGGFLHVAEDATHCFPRDTELAKINGRSYAGITLNDAKGAPIGLLVVVHSAPIDTGLDVEQTLRLFGARAAAELERADNEARLIEARRNAEAASLAKSEFLANMSHEIRTPMTAIMGYADILHDAVLNRNPDPGNNDTPLDDAIVTVRNNARHLLTIINDILDMSKIEAGQLTVEHIQTDPIAIAAEAIALLAPQAERKGIALTARAASATPASISTDPTRLRQVLLNILGNAIKFTHHGEVSLHVTHDRRSNNLRFVVRDTGVGMNEEQRRRVARFDAFTQADTSTTREFGGTGLGLRVSNALAELLGGGIDIQSAQGVGTTVIISIDVRNTDHTEPRSVEQADAILAPHATQPNAHQPATPPANHTDDHTDRPAAPDAAPLEGLRILLAEDGADNQRLITHHLTKAGANVTLAENGQDAIETIERQPRDHFDAILMDMQMPVLDGYSATMTLRERHVDTPIIALTAHAMAGDRQRCLDAGCDDYLTKPIDVQLLIHTCASRATADHTTDAA